MTEKWGRKMVLRYCHRPAFLYPLRATLNLMVIQRKEEGPPVALMNANGRPWAGITASMDIHRGSMGRKCSPSGIRIDD